MMSKLEKLRDFKGRIVHLPKNIKSLLKEHSDTYYPNEPRKSKVTIFFEQFKQIITKGDYCEDYFFYGLDRKSVNIKDYVSSYLEFKRKRDALNLKNLHNSSCLLVNKFYFGLYASSIGGGIITPENIGLYRNGKLLLINEKKQVDLADFLTNPVKYGLATIDLFIKQIDGECGTGVFHLHDKDGKYVVGEKEKSVDDIVKDMSTGSWILQKRFIQHKLLNKIYPKSVNTIRMVTVKGSDGKPHVFSAVLRIGAMGKEVDNYSQGGVIVEIDKETGKLYKYGFRKQIFGGRGTTHPDTGFKYDGVTIPFFEEAKRCALYFHSMLFDMHSIGWDIAISENGPVFIEGNDNWEIPLHQMNYGMRIEFDKYFHY